MELNAQVDPLGDIFIGSQPIWSHVAMDSSAIGYKGRTGMDYFAVLSERRFIVHDQHVYLVYENNFESVSGCFLEKLDIHTGKIIWSNYFDLRNSAKREYTNRFFINENQELELLNLRYSYDTLDPFFLNWTTGKLSVRKYDIHTGEEVFTYHSPIENDDYSSFGAVENSSSYLVKNGEKGYDCYTHWARGNPLTFGMARTRMDSSGKKLNVITSPNLISKFPLIGFAHRPHLLNYREDTILRVLHTLKDNPFKTGDSIELSICFFDKDLNLLLKRDIGHLVSGLKEYVVISTKNNHTCILGTEYFEDRSYPRQHIVVVDPLGNIAEEIVYPGRINDSIGKCVGVLKLKNEPGILILNRIPEKNNLKMLLYKSDGIGNMTLISSHTMRDSYNIVIEGYMEEVEGNKLVLSGLYRQYHLNPGTYNKTERFITSLWDLNTTDTRDESDYDYSNLTLFPNPTGNDFKIQGIERIDHLRLKIFDQKGKLVMNRNQIPASDSRISVAHLTNGLYFVELFDGATMVYAGKLVISK